jgi:cyclic pyranopterin phosphate synthase
VLRDPNCDEAAIRTALITAIRNKPQGHHLRERLAAGGDCHGRMSRIGG